MCFNLLSTIRVILVFAILLTARTANADLITGTFSGYIDTFIDYGEQDDRQDEYYNGDRMFDEIFKTGDEISGSFSFYSGDVPADYLDAEPNIGHYHAHNNDWFSFNLVIGNNNFDINHYFSIEDPDEVSYQNDMTFFSGSTEEQFVINSGYHAEKDYLNDDGQLLSLSQGSSLFFVALGDENLLNGIDTSQSISWQDRDGYSGVTNLFLRDFLFNNQTATFEYYRAAKFNIHLTDFSYNVATTVPEPNTFILILLSLFGFILHREKKISETN